MEQSGNGNVIKKKEKIKRRIQHLDIREENFGLRTTEVEERTNLKNQLHAILLQEEIIWKQRSPITWLKHGDQNTRFFHVMASVRKRKNTIAYLEHQGEAIHDP